MKHAGVAEHADHRRQATGVVEILHQVTAGRHEVDHGRHITAEPVPVIKAEIDANTSGDGDEMDDGVGRTADGAVEADGVLERLAG